MPLHLSGHTQAPPGGWSFRIIALAERAPQLAWVGPYHTFPDLCAEVIKRCKANGLPAPAAADIEDQICQRAPDGFCRDDLGLPTIGPGSGGIGASVFTQATKTFFSWIANGRRRVSQDRVVARTYVCNKCPENLPISGCSGCAMRDVRDIIAQMVTNPLPSDAVLGACGVCQCSLKLKVRAEIDDFLPHMSEAQIKRLPDACWIKTERAPNPPPLAVDVLT